MCFKPVGNCWGRVAPSLGRLPCYLFSFKKILCRSWKNDLTRSSGPIPFYKWGNRSGLLRTAWLLVSRVWDKNPDRVTFRHLPSPQIHELPTSVSHFDIIALLQEAIDCNFKSLSFSIVKMCFAHIGSGRSHETSLLGEAAVREKNFTDLNLTLCHKCCALCFAFFCHSLYCWRWALQVDRAGILGFVTGQILIGCNLCPENVS